MQVDQFKKVLNFISKNFSSFKKENDLQKNDDVFCNTVRHILEDINPTLCNKLRQSLTIYEKIDTSGLCNSYVLRLQLDSLFNSSLTFYKSQLYSVYGVTEIKKYKRQVTTKKLTENNKIVLQHNGIKENYNNLTLVTNPKRLKKDSFFQNEEVLKNTKKVKMQRFICNDCYKSYGSKDELLMHKKHKHMQNDIKL